MGLLKTLFDLGADPVPEVPLVRYERIRPSLQDLDLLLWVGKGSFSRLIQFGTGSWSSHTSTVKTAQIKTDGRWTDEDADPVGDALEVGEPARARMILNFESTTLNKKVRDVYSRTVRSGSQTNALSERLANYDGRVFVRRLSGRRTTKLRRTYEQVRRETSGLVYERSIGELIRAATFLPDRENRASVFCSELTAYVYRRCGVIGGSRPSNSYVPEAFEPGGAIEDALRPGWAFCELLELDLRELREKQTSTDRKSVFYPVEEATT